MYILTIAMLSLKYLLLVTELWARLTLAASVCQCDSPALVKGGWEIDYYPHPPLVGVDNNTFYVNGFTQYGPAFAHQSGYTSSIDIPRWHSDSGKHDLFGVSITTYNFTVVLSGFFMAPETGTYTIALTADEAAAVQFGEGSNCSQELSSSVLKCGIAQEVRSGAQNGGWGIKTQSLKFVKGKYYPVRIIWWQLGGWLEFIFDMTTPSGKKISGFENSIFQLSALGSSCPGATCTSLYSSAKVPTSSTSSSRTTVTRTTTTNTMSFAAASSGLTTISSSKMVTSFTSSLATSATFLSVSSLPSSSSIWSSHMRPEFSRSLESKSSKASRTFMISKSTSPGSTVVESVSNSNNPTGSKSGIDSIVTSSFLESSTFSSTESRSFLRILTHSNVSTTLSQLATNTISTESKLPYSKPNKSSRSDSTFEYIMSSCTVYNSSTIASITNKANESSTATNTTLSSSETYKESYSASIVASTTAESSSIGVLSGTSFKSKSNNIGIGMPTTKAVSSIPNLPSNTIPENSEKNGSTSRTNSMSVASQSFSALGVGSTRSEDEVTNSHIPTKTNATATSSGAVVIAPTESEITPSISVSSISPTNNASTIARHTLNILFGLIVALLM